MSQNFKTENELEAIVRGFETCTTPATDFPHRSHLVLATWYLTNATVDQAMASMRASILNFLKHYDIKGKYNETITRFWILVVDGCLRNLGDELTLLERTNAVIFSLNNSRLIFEYYSQELLWSDRAKSEWVEPDVKELNLNA